MWAMAVTAGAGVFLNRPGVKLVLGIVSFFLLLILAAIFARAAWHGFQTHQVEQTPPEGLPDAGTAKASSRTYLLGLTFALTSPWNIGFWLAVIGGQRTLVANPSLVNSVSLAGSVVLGAMAWGIVLCACLRLGARVFARPAWQIATQVLSAAVMLWFAGRLAVQLLQGN